MQHRDNLIRLRGDKQREIDRLRGQLEDCQAALADSQVKEQALGSRKRMLEREVLFLRPVVIISTSTVSVHPYTQLRTGWLDTVARNPFVQVVPRSHSCGDSIGLQLPACAQVKGLRQKVGLLLDKSATDDKLISALRAPLAQFAPAAKDSGDLL